GGDAEEAGLGVDGTEAAGGVGTEPGDVVADGGDLPALFGEGGGRHEHGEVGFSAGGGEGGGDVGFFAVGILQAEDEHVLGHPAFVAGHHGGDAEGEALFA